MPKGVKEELEKGLKWHDEGKSGEGLKPETVSWARRMAGGADISPEKAIKMRAWLARHESDKKGEGYKPGEPGFPSAGRVAWALWGGDPAVTWSNKIVTQMKIADEDQKSTDSIEYKQGKQIIDRVWKEFIKKQHGPTERKLLKATNKYLQGASKRYVQRFNEQIKKNYDPKNKSFIVDWVSFIGASIEKLYIVEIIGEVWKEEFKKSGIRELSRIFRIAKKDPFKFVTSWKDYGDLLQGVSKKFIDSLADEVQKTTSKEMQRIVSNGLNEGLPITDISQLIRNSTGFNKKRGMLIARTESTRLHGQATQTSINDANDFGLKVKKSWIGNLDQYTRETHRSMIKFYARKENAIDQNDFFISPSGAVTLTPGGFSEASEDCNCRCSVLPVVVTE